ncbi:Visual pigment-like receptor peropsin [Exaiptasia diaphana]|nr:Visual pigment-like receptor peropsin [Exaiptasia diaphana]
MQPWNGDAFVSIPLKTNTSSNFCTFEYIYESNEIRVARLTAESFLALVGVLFNVAICVINLKHSNINVSIRLYIRNMALADIGVLLLGFPFAVAKEQQGTYQWVLGNIACKYIYPFTDAFYAVSTWTLVVIAIHRYRIIKPKSWRRRKQSRAVRVLVVLWITALIIISLPILLASHYSKTCGKNYCFIRWPSSSPTNTIPAKVHSFSLIFLLFIFPVGVVVWSYFKVSVKLRRGNCAKKGGVRHRRLQSDSDNTNPIVFSEQDEVRHNECAEAKRFLTPLGVARRSSILALDALSLHEAHVNYHNRFDLDHRTVF